MININMSIGSSFIFISVIVSTIFAVIVVFAPMFFQMLWYAFVAVVSIGLLISARAAINLIFEGDGQ